MTCGKGFDKKRNSSGHDQWSHSDLSQSYMSDKDYTYRSKNFLPNGIDEIIVLMALCGRPHSLPGNPHGMCFMSFLVSRPDIVEPPSTFVYNEVYRKEWGWSKLWWSKGYRAYMIKHRKIFNNMFPVTIGCGPRLTPTVDQILYANHVSASLKHTHARTHKHANTRKHAQAQCHTHIK